MSGKVAATELLRLHGGLTRRIEDSTYCTPSMLRLLAGRTDMMRDLSVHIAQMVTAKVGSDLRAFENCSWTEGVFDEILNRLKGKLPKQTCQALRSLCNELLAGRKVVTLAFENEVLPLAGKDVHNAKSLGEKTWGEYNSLALVALAHFGRLPKELAICAISKGSDGATFAAIKWENGVLRGLSQKERLASDAFALTTKVKRSW